MGKRKKKKKQSIATIIILCLVIVVCVVVLVALVRGKLISSIKSAVAEKVMEQVIQQALESSGDPQAAARAKEILDSIDEQDKKEVEEIIGKYTDSDTVSDLMHIVGSDFSLESIERAVEYMQESITQEDIRKLQEMYEKYGGTSALDF